MTNEPTTYAQSGVDVDREEQGMNLLGAWITKSFGLRPDLGRPVLPLGHYANVIALTDRLGLAVSADGVGTKIFVAEMMDRYDSVGIDCVAMNVNDLICIGAEPLAMLDYIAVQTPHPRLLEELGKGLYRACELAQITIPGGEVAQVREMIKGVRDTWSFDLVGTAVGTVDLDRIITGKACAAGDVVIGIASSGLHSNGYTLARRVCFDTAKLTVDSHVSELGGKLGETLLVPTAIYVREVMAMLKSGLPVKGMAHITSDGLTNLLRVEAEVGYDIHTLPEPPTIFELLQAWGKIEPAEMYEVFNMGVGLFCVVADRDAADDVLAAARSDGKEAWVIGEATPGPREVRLHPVGLVGRGNHFTKA